MENINLEQNIDADGEFVDTNISNSDTDESVETSEVVKQKQSDEQNKIAAAARRQADAEMKALKAKQDAFAKKYGYNTFEELEAAQLKQEQEASRQQYEQAGINPDLVNKLIEEHPLVRAAREREINEKVTNAIAELNSEFDLDFKDINDIIKLPNYDQIYKYVQRGFTLAEAYKQVNFAELATKKVNAAKQQAINNVNSKAHIKSTGKGVDISEIEVPPETIKMYKQFFPKWSDKQIREHYAKEMN